MRAAVVAALAAAAVPAAAQEVAPVEQRIAAFVDRHVEEAIALLERVVNVNSGTMSPAGVRAVGDVFRAELDALGFETRWIPGEAFGRAGHLVAERSGEGPRLLLIGHLDTVFEADSAFQRFERDGWTATGPGVLDMKGGDVVMLYALKALAEAGELDGISAAVILTGDEEATGEPLEESRRELIALARGSAFAIGFEDGDGNPATAVIARRGSTSWRLDTTGVRAHSSVIHRDGIGSGAIFEAARILAAFHEIREPTLTLSPGALLGGTRVDYDAAASRGTAYGKENVIAQKAVVTGDLRALSLEQREAVKRRMLEVAAAHLPGTGAELVFRDSYPPMEPSDANRRLLGLLDRASRDLGLGEVAAADLVRLGAADISFAAPHVRAAIDGLGMGGSGGHTAQESADLRTLAVQAKRAALLMRRLAAGAFDTDP